MLMEWNPKTPSLWDWDFPGPVYSSSSIDSSPYAGILTPAMEPREPLIGLKLGKRTYFEDVGAGARNPNPNPTTSTASSSPSAVVKRSRVSHQSVQAFRCQVEGCNVDLTGAKDYHRKHRVCKSHSKCPLVVVDGQNRRFCQQCSRFHDLSAFDDNKRSCRKRLSDHNARRRKPQPETIAFNSGKLSSPFYDDRQQMNLLLNRVPFGHISPSAISTWEGPCDFKLGHVKGSCIKSTKGDNEGRLLLHSTDSSDFFPTVGNDLDRLVPFKGTTAKVLDQGTEASMVASNLNGAPGLRRALSLLSTKSWISAEPGPTTSLTQPVHTNHISAAQPVINAMNIASHYWQDEHPLVQQAPVLQFAMRSNGSQSQESQLLKAPYETTLFYSS